MIALIMASNSKTSTYAKLVLSLNRAGRNTQPLVGVLFLSCCGNDWTNFGDTKHYINSLFAHTISVHNSSIPFVNIVIGSEIFQ